MTLLDHPSVGMSQDHADLIAAVREYARRELVERDRQWDREESSCCTQLEQYCELGLMGLRVPEELGGVDCPMVPYAGIICELAWASPSVAVTISVHSMVCEILRTYARPDVRDETLSRMITPGNLSAFAISEPGAGSDPASAVTRAEKTAGGWTLHGTKMWVTNGLTGRWFVVMARTGRDARNFSMFLMDAELDEVRRSPIHGKMGIRGSETAEMILEGVFVPEERLLGEVGDGLKIGLSALAGGRIGIAAQALGIGQACLDLMVAYAKQREQFGRPIADFQAIQWMIADSQTECMAARHLIERAAELKDLGRPFVQEASMAKLFASEAANRIAYRAVQVHGGAGFVNDCRVEQLYRDARITTIYEGTSEVQRYVIARELLRGDS
jgi:alkylation response protein AidB-like acyl-CoA dehydrogenase